MPRRRIPLLMKSRLPKQPSRPLTRSQSSASSTSLRLLNEAASTLKELSDTLAPPAHLSQEPLEQLEGYSPEEQLMKLLAFIPDDSPMFGEIEAGMIRMPKQSTDARKLTWTRMIQRKCNEICNTPRHGDCWLVPLAGDYSSNYKMLKLSKTGASNKYALFRVLFALAKPHRAKSIQRRRRSTATDLLQSVCAHLCGRGRGVTREDTVCINPLHVVYIPHDVNLDQDRCRYGCRLTCPHYKFPCIWTDADGHLIPCFNDRNWNGTCTHKVRCEHISRVYDCNAESLSSHNLVSTPR